MKRINTNLLIGCFAILGLALGTAARAEAKQAIPFKGTITSFNEVCGGVDFPEGCIVTIGLDLDLGEVELTDLDPFAEFTLRGKAGGALFFLGDSTWDFGFGNTLESETKGVIATRSRRRGDPAAFNTEVKFTITGGTGRFAGASGSAELHLLFSLDVTRISGTVNGVIILPF